MNNHTSHPLMKKRMKIMIIALGVVFGGLIAFNVVKSLMMAYFFAHYKPPAVSVSSAIAESVDWQPTLHAIGNFSAINGVEVGAQANGDVIKIEFESGQYVAKDTPLVTLDDSVEQALLKFNQAELKLKELNYKRQTDLFKRGATPGSSVDEADANLQQARAKVEETEAQISHKHIIAPFAGRLGIRKINLGQYILAGQTAIVSLQSLDPLHVQFYLPEQLYKKIKVNQKITFAVEGFHKMLFEGKITAIDSRADLTTHNIQVEATMPNCPVEGINNLNASNLITTRKETRGSKLVVSCDTARNQSNQVQNYIFIPGMFASIEIAQPAQKNTIIVPSTAVSYSLYGNAVYLIEKTPPPKGKGDPILTVKRVFVTTGETQGNFTVIQSGLQAGQMVVSTGDLKLQNGTEVSINNSVTLHNDLNPEQLGQ